MRLSETVPVGDREGVPVALLSSESVSDAESVGESVALRVMFNESLSVHVGVSEYESDTDFGSVVLGVRISESVRLSSSDVLTLSDGDTEFSDSVSSADSVDDSMAVNVTVAVGVGGGVMVSVGVSDRDRDGVRVGGKVMVVIVCVLEAVLDGVGGGVIV